MTTPSDAEIRAKHLDTIAAFVLRARRVEAHSWAEGREELLKAAKKPMDFGRDPDTGEWLMHVQLPDEEVVESMAARVRPLILQGDRVHGLSVMKALNYFVRGASDEFRAGLDGLREDWKRYDSNSRELAGYELQQFDSQTGEAVELTDTVLGFAWIYGDTVHADPLRLAETELVGVEARYEAAVPLVARIAVTTISTLNAIRILMREGRVELPDDVFERSVVVTETTLVRPVAIHTAPAWTPAPTTMLDAATKLERGPWTRLE